MKKSIIFVLICITLVFASYVGGFYVGRNHVVGGTQIIGILPEVTQHITTGTRPLPQTTATTIPSAPVIGPTQTQSTEPTRPTQPTQPTQPAEPPQPTQPTQPTQPAEPTQPTQPTEPTQSTQPTMPALINVNTATLEQLDTLPGIGPKLAQAIIDYRTEYGPFETPEDLLYVPGIGEKKLAAIIDLITTGG